MCSCASFSFFSVTSSALFERGDLAAQRADLLIENFDLRDGARGRRLLEIDLRTEPADFGLAGVVARLRAFGGAAHPVALAFDGGERGAQLRDLGLEAGLAGPLQRQKLGEARDLRGQAGQRRILAGDLLRQKELRHHEHGEQKDDREDERRQRVDKARPVIHAAVAAASRKGHAVLRLSERSRAP